jgi:hypothetical protein
VLGTDVSNLDGCNPTAMPVPVDTLQCFFVFASTTWWACRNFPPKGTHVPAHPPAAPPVPHGPHSSRPEPLCASHDPTLCMSPGRRGWILRGEHPLPGHWSGFVASSRPDSPHRRWRGLQALPRLGAEGGAHPGPCAPSMTQLRARHPTGPPMKSRVFRVEFESS